MKRAITVLLVACVLLFSSLTVASASMFDVIAPMADNYSNINVNLDIASGKAEVSATLYGRIGVTTKATIHLYLQQYKDGKWEDYDDWLKSENATSCALSKTISIPKGANFLARHPAMRMREITVSMW